MATDYDAPRKNEDEYTENSIEELKNSSIVQRSVVVDEDEIEAAGGSSSPAPTSQIRNCRCG